MTKTSDVKRKLDDITELFNESKKAYDNGESPLNAIIRTSINCLTILDERQIKEQGIVGHKKYSIYKNKNALSRPFIPELFIQSIHEYASKAAAALTKIDGDTHIIDYDAHEIDKIVYTTIMAFAICYDLFKPSSRKTPGTFFEIITGSILSSLLPQYARGKHINIPDHDEKISTDTTFKRDNTATLVVPAKITTRERIVQPYAHQRILDSIFGETTHKSILVCVSETQREREHKVNEICVPGTIALFQKHLAKLTAIYYLDPPLRYLEPSVYSLVPVKPMSSLFCGDLSKIISS